MRTIRVASISLVGLMAAGTFTAAAGQPSQRPPSVELKRLPATQEGVTKAVDRVAPRPPARPTGRMVLGGIGERQTTVAPQPGPRPPARPPAAPRPILKTQPPRWSMEAVDGQKRVQVSPQPPRVQKIPNEARQTLADPTSRTAFKEGHKTHTRALVNQQPASTPGPRTTASTASPTRPVTVHRTTASSASPTRPVTVNRTTASSASPTRPVTAHRTTASTATRTRPVSAPHGAVKAGAQAGKIAAGSAAKAVVGGAVGGVLVGGSIEVISQELNSPGKTIDDIRRGNINPKWNEIAASAVSGGAATGAVAAGAAALPALAVGAAAYGTVMIADQEIRDPGKTARDIKAMTGIDLKKAGSDVNKVADTAAKAAAKAASKPVTDIGKAASKTAKDVEKGLLSIFGKK